jgi:hypothetical protein
MSQSQEGAMETEWVTLLRTARAHAFARSAVLSWCGMVRRAKSDYGWATTQGVDRRCTRCEHTIQHAKRRKRA